MALVVGAMRLLPHPPVRDGKAVPLNMATWKDLYQWLLRKHPTLQVSHSITYLIHSLDIARPF